MENKNKVVGHCDDGYPLDKNGNIVGIPLPERDMIIISLPTTGELMENAVEQANMSDQILRQLFLKADLSLLIELMKEKVDFEYQDIRQQLISEEGDEEDMDDEAFEDYVNTEAKETFNSLYHISYDDWHN